MSAFNKINISENFFEKASRTDFKLMNIICSDHIDKLNISSADSYVKSLYNCLLPAKDRFVNNYANWVVSNYTYSFHSKKIVGLFDDLKSFKMPLWIERIKEINKDGLLSYDDFIAYENYYVNGADFNTQLCFVKDFISALAKYPCLRGVKKEASETRRIIQNALSELQAKSAVIDNDFRAIELSRLELADIMFCNFNFLIDKFGSSENKLKNFFNFDIILYPDKYKSSYNLLNIYRPDKEKIINPVF